MDLCQRPHVHESGPYLNGCVWRCKDLCQIHILCADEPILKLKKFKKSFSLLLKLVNGSNVQLAWVPSLDPVDLKNYHPFVLFLLPVLFGQNCNHFVNPELRILSSPPIFEITSCCGTCSICWTGQKISNQSQIDRLMCFRF